MSENNFIREQIKEKPVNKKKLVYKVGTSALCGLAFAIVASVGIAVLEPRFLALSSKETQTENTETSETETEIIESEVTETEESTEPVEYTLTLEDYQAIQSELYHIGANANKSIVSVTGVSSDLDWFNNSYENENQESGVIISETSSRVLILTERKNIATADRISVSFADDTSAEATMISYDGNTGLAVLSVDTASLLDSTRDRIESATFGNSSLVSNGQMVIALGSPLGTNYSILVGNITSKTNMIHTSDCNYNIFTTDIVASKGGTGVLINTSGEIVAVVMQDYSNRQGEGTLTAVAANDLQKLIQLLAEGKTIPYMGLELTTVTDKIEKNYDIPKGVFVKEVALDSPAMVGGIQPGDVITEFDGVDVNAAVNLSNQLLTHSAGDVVKIKLERQSGESYKEVTLEIELGIK